MVTHYQTWTTSKITRSMVNSSSFGVKLDYPANTNSSEGTVSISYVRVEVTYKVPSYSLTLKKVSGGYNEESYTVEASISNTNLTGYNPSCTLTAPTGFSFTNFDGTGVRSAAELSKELGLSDRTIKAHISLLKEAGFIEHIGGKTYGHWEIVAGAENED